MNKNAIIGAIAAVAVLIGIIVLSSATYTVNEREQVIITQFGEPKGSPKTSAGLQFKIPFVQKVNVIEKRILEWDGRANEMTTKDKTYIIVSVCGMNEAPSHDWMTFLDQRRVTRSRSMN